MNAVNSSVRGCLKQDSLGLVLNDVFIKLCSFKVLMGNCRIGYVNGVECNEEIDNL